MELITDLQIHSKYARAVSNKMDLFEIAKWGAWKGIHLVATGDWTHPVWFEHICQELKEVRPGIFVLKNPLLDIPHQPEFLLSAEVSCIYSHNGRLRRIHHLIFSPSLEVCKKIIESLQKRGAKLASDGRPIIGMSSRTLLELVLEASPDAMVIPAHAWTPWFGMFGSKSGYDSIAECFGDLSSHIYAIETGLSSDPLMNWSIPELEGRSIVSFSDAHSGPKLGREATVFSGEKDWDYFDVIGAIKQDAKSKLSIDHTLEFFPEEGKYHWNGHREHNVCMSTHELLKKGIICPVCKRVMTLGVEKRVADLADGKLQSKMSVVKDTYGVQYMYDEHKKRKPFVSLIPLEEILREVYNGSPTKAKREYERLVTTWASEFEILLHTSLLEIAEKSTERLAKAIEIVRARTVHIEPGFDGVFGTIKIFSDEQHDDAQLQLLS